ncbi:CTP-dependent riboflavin kinase, partial [Candidatus Woesearchaeota archaeon]|nr:CTP-dependent riboflavin kinase [Candidatus Woesearchaeota archaeon]
GRLALLGVQGMISSALAEKPTLMLRGHLTKGLGEGKYYVSLNHYQDELTRLLGREPWPGTMNLRVKPEDRALFLAGIEPIEIKGFSSKKRTYGSVLFYPIRIGDRECGLLLPTRTTYGPEKVELVDSIELRPALQLKEGDEVVVERRVQQ